MNEALATLLQEALLPTAVALLSALAAWLTTSAKRLIDARVAAVKSDTARALLERVATAAHRAVAATSQTFVDAIKERSEDGRLTRAEAQEALQLAMGAVWAELGEAGRAELKQITANPTKVVADAVEAAVNTRGKSRPLSKSERELELEALHTTLAALAARGV